MGMSVWYAARDEQESLATLHRAIDLGVTFIDTLRPRSRVSGAAPANGAGPLRPGERRRREHRRPLPDDPVRRATPPGDVARRDPIDVSIDPLLNAFSALR